MKNLILLIIVCLSGIRVDAQTIELQNGTARIAPVYGNRPTTATDSVRIRFKMHSTTTIDRVVELSVTPANLPYGPQLPQTRFTIVASNWKDNQFIDLVVPVQQTNRPSNLIEDELAFITIAPTSPTPETAGSHGHFGIRVLAALENEIEDASDSAVLYASCPVIRYKFLDGRLQVPKNMHFHPKVYKPFIVRIDDINRGAYRIDITAKDSVFSVSQPDDFLSALQQLKAAKPSSATDTGKAAKEKETGESDISDEDKQMIKKSDNVTVDKEQMIVSAPATARNEAITVANQLNKSLEMQAVISAPIPDTIRQKVKERVENNESIKNIISDSLQVRLYKIKIGSAAAQPAPQMVPGPMEAFIHREMKDAFFRLRILKLNLYDYSDAITRSIMTTNDLLNALQNRFLTKSRYLSQYNPGSIIDTLVANLLKAKQTFDRVDGISNTLQALQSDARKYRTRDTMYQQYDDAELLSVKNLYKSMHVDSLLNIINKSGLNMRYLKTGEFYHFNSVPIIPFGDMIKIKVRITAIDSADSKQPNDAKTYEIQLYTRNRVRFDFSTGIGLTHGLTDMQYKIQQRPSVPGVPDSAVITEAGPRQLWSPMIGGFLHTSIDVGSTVKPAITLGLSLNTESLDLTTVLLGMTLFIGRDDRIALTGGGALKRINMLRSDYSTDKLYSTANLGADASGVTTPTWKWGWFFAVSYNLTNKPNTK